MRSLDEIIRKNIPIVIFGTGKTAVKLLYTLNCKGIDVEFCLDNYDNCKTLMEYEIKRPSSELLKDKYIVVATVKRHYRTIAKQLKEYGLKEFEDFTYCEWIYGKKLVLLHGNCYMACIEKYLLSSEEFKDKYVIYPNPPIFDIQEGIEEDVLKNVELWIHQDIQEDNIYGKKVSDMYIREKIKADVEEIIVPNLVGLGGGFYPQMELGNKRNKPTTAMRYGMFPYADSVIDKCMSKRMSVQEIVNYFQTDIYSEDYIKENFKNYIDKIRQREKKWDIKILEDIIENYKTEQIFYDPIHPTNFLIFRISQRILNRLGISGEEIYCDSDLGAYEGITLPCVARALGYSWQREHIRIHGNMCLEKMDLMEYVKEYIWWCYSC